MRVRRLGPDDAGAVDALLDLFGEAFEDRATYGAARPGPEYRARLLGDANIVMLVAEQDGGVIGGLVGYVLHKLERERAELYIYDLAVAEPARRQGVATALIDALRPIARAAGAWVIYVQADLADEPAVRLYSKLGVREDVLHFDIAP